MGYSIPKDCLAVILDFRTSLFRLFVVFCFYGEYSVVAYEQMVDVEYAAVLFKLDVVKNGISKWNKILFDHLRNDSFSFLTSSVIAEYALCLAHLQ